MVGRRFAGGEPGVVFAGKDGAAAETGAVAVAGRECGGIFRGESEQRALEFLETVLAYSFDGRVKSDAGVAQQPAKVGLRHRREPLGEFAPLGHADSGRPVRVEVLADLCSLAFPYGWHGDT